MSDLNFHILLVEDEERLASILKLYLEKEGWEVTLFTNAEDASEYIHVGIHLWIIDIMLPGMSGFDLIQKVKENNSEQPVIFISARDRDLDKIQGLEMGSDDYLAKPFLPKELVIRAKKLLHRIYGQGLKSHYIEVSDYKFDVNRRKVLDKEMQEIELTMKEFDVALFLLENINIAKTRDEILVVVWGDGYVGSTRAVDDVVRRVRKKLPRLTLETLYRAGYRIVA